MAQHGVFVLSCILSEKGPTTAIRTTRYAIPGIFFYGSIHALHIKYVYTLRISWFVPRICYERVVLSTLYSYVRTCYSSVITSDLWQIQCRRIGWCQVPDTRTGIRYRWYQVLVLLPGTGSPGYWWHQLLVPVPATYIQTYVYSTGYLLHREIFFGNVPRGA